MAAFPAVTPTVTARYMTAFSALAGPRKTVPVSAIIATIVAGTAALPLAFSISVSSTRSD